MYLIVFPIGEPVVIIFAKCRLVYFSGCWFLQVETNWTIWPYFRLYVRVNLSCLFVVLAAVYITFINAPRFFCALDPNLRLTWAETVSRLLKPDGELITLIYLVRTESPCFLFTLHWRYYCTYHMIFCSSNFKLNSKMWTIWLPLHYSVIKIT
jgi:hypothetical protein